MRRLMVSFGFFFLCVSVFCVMVLCCDMDMGLLGCCVDADFLCDRSGEEGGVWDG